MLKEDLINAMSRRKLKQFVIIVHFSKAKSVGGNRFDKGDDPLGSHALLTHSDKSRGHCFT